MDNAPVSSDQPSSPSCIAHLLQSCKPSNVMCSADGSYGLEAQVAVSVEHASMTAASVTQMLKALTPSRPSPHAAGIHGLRSPFSRVKREEETETPLTMQEESRECKELPSKRHRKEKSLQFQARVKRVKTESDVGGRRGVTPLPFDINETFGDEYGEDDVFVIERIHAVRLKV